MSKSATLENDLLLLIFNNVNITLVGDATGLRGSTTVGSLYIALHTADPGEAGDQTTNETGYVGYARVGVERSAAGFAVTGSSVSPANNVTFTECTDNPGKPITHFSVGTSTSGTGKVLYSGTVTPPINMANGIIPRLAKTSTITEE